MPETLTQAHGPSERYDVWWRDEHSVHASCTKCGFMQTVHPDPDMRAEYRCLGCGTKRDARLIGD